MSKILESDVNAVRAMRESGVSFDAIATCLNRSESSVQGIARNNGILLKNKPEKPVGKKYDRTLRQPQHVMSRPQAIFTEIHDIIMYGIFNPQNNEETPHI